MGIYFDTDIDIATQRIRERNNKSKMQPHYSESKESLLMKKARYEAMIPYEKYPILVIDANQNVDGVYSSVFKILNEIVKS